MVSALVCMVTHWTKPMVSHDVKLSVCYNFTRLLCCIISQLRENIEPVLKLVMTLSYI